MKHHNAISDKITISHEKNAGYINKFLSTLIKFILNNYTFQERNFSAASLRWAYNLSFHSATEDPVHAFFVIQ